MNKEMSEAQRHREPYSPSRCRAEPWPPALVAVSGAGCPRGPRFGCCPPWSTGSRTRGAWSTQWLSLRLALGVTCIAPVAATPPAVSSRLANLAPTQLSASALALLVGSVGQGSRNGLFPFQHRQKRCGRAASPIYTTTAELVPCSFPCFGAGDMRRSPGTPKLMKKSLFLPTRGQSSII